MGASECFVSIQEVRNVTRTIEDGEVEMHKEVGGRLRRLVVTREFIDPVFKDADLVYQGVKAGMRCHGDNCSVKSKRG